MRTNYFISFLSLNYTYNPIYIRLYKVWNNMKVMLIYKYISRVR